MSAQEILAAALNAEREAAAGRVKDMFAALMNETKEAEDRK